MKNNIQKIGSALLKNISTNSPLILTSLGVAGLVGTAILAVKATPKALQILEDEKELRLDEGSTNYDLAGNVILSNVDTIKLTWKCYIPTAIMGGVTIACIIGVNSIHMQRNAALASLYSLTETTLKEYQAKVVETLGKDKEEKIRSEIDADRVHRNPPSNSEIIMVGKGDVLCFDSSSGRYFKSDVENLRKIQNDFNESLLNGCGGTITLNEVYYAFGLGHTKVGDQLGWTIEAGQIKFEFSSQLAEDNTPCLVINYETVPIFEYGSR